MKKTSIILLAIIFLFGCKKDKNQIFRSSQLSVSQTQVISNPDTVTVNWTPTLVAKYVQDKINLTKYNVTFKAKGKSESAVLYMTTLKDTVTRAYYSTTGAFYFSYRTSKNSVGDYKGTGMGNMFSTYLNTTQRQSLAACVAHAYHSCSDNFWCNLECLSSQAGIIFCGASFAAGCAGGYL